MLNIDYYPLLKPDLVIFLDVPPEIGRDLNVNKAGRPYLEGKAADEAEEDSEHQLEAYKEYLLTVENEDYWVRVDCVRDGRLKDPELIGQRVWNEVLPILGGELGEGKIGGERQR